MRISGARADAAPVSDTDSGADDRGADLRAYRVADSRADASADA